MFTSDNGFLFGEHRITSGKVFFYEPSIRVPLMVRGPGIPSGVTRRRARREHRPRADDPRPGRRHTLAGDGRPVAGPGAARRRDDPVPTARSSWSREARTTPNKGLRTPRYAYFEDNTGERELYDLRKDPDELVNRHGDPAYAVVEQQLADAAAGARVLQGRRLSRVTESVRTVREVAASRADGPRAAVRYPAPVPVVPQFVGDSVMRIGDTDFHYEHPLDVVPPGHLGIEKIRPLLEAYIALWAQHRPRRVVELGIRRGGSTAMLNELGGAERIVSVELSETRREALDRYIEARGAQDIVHPHYGVDQADRERLAQIVDDEFAGAPLDLVIDDASHLYAESRASFEVLFPSLRPGGLYLLEDWRSQHMLAAQLTAALDASEALRHEIEAAHGRRGPGRAGDPDVAPRGGARHRAGHRRRRGRRAGDRPRLGGRPARPGAPRRARRSGSTTTRPTTCGCSHRCGDDPRWLSSRSGPRHPRIGPRSWGSSGRRSAGAPTSGSPGSSPGSTTGTRSVPHRRWSRSTVTGSSGCARSSAGSSWMPGARCTGRSGRSTPRPTPSTRVGASSAR